MQSSHPNAASFPKGISGPALRALHTAGLTSLAALTRVSERELAAMHGMGPKAIRILREALHERGLTFRNS